MARKKEKVKLIKYLDNLTLKDKILMTFSVMAFLLVIVYLIVLSPTRNNINNVTQSINTLNSQKDQLIIQNKKSDELTKKLYSEENEYNNLLKNIPKTEEQARLVKNIVQIEKKENLKMQNLKFNVINPKQENNKIVEMHQAILQVSGGYKNILELVNLLQQNKRKLIINSVQVQKNNMQSGDANQTFEGNITFSYFNLNLNEKNKK